jgi:hypothetical protein
MLLSGDTIKDMPTILGLDLCSLLFPLCGSLDDESVSRDVIKFGLSNNKQSEDILYFSVIIIKILIFYLRN